MYHTDSFLPSNWDAFTFEGYSELFSKTEFVKENANEWYPIWNWLFNSLIVALGGTLLYLIIASLAAYAFVFLDFKYKDAIFGVLIATLVIPGIISTTPQLINMNMLNAYKSLWGLVLPGLGGVYGLYLIRQFLVSIPKDLIENARMDGASNLRIFFSIIVPLSKPIIATVAVFCFIGVWNDYLWPIMVLPYAAPDEWPLYPIQAALTSIQSIEGITTGQIMASLVVTSLPIFIVYIVAQKYIVQGFGSAGLKL